MSSERATRTSYGDLESPSQMRADCLLVGDNLRLERALRGAGRPAPSVHYDDFPREIRKRDIAISDAAARLAAALHLHLD